MSKIEGNKMKADGIKVASFTAPEDCPSILIRNTLQDDSHGNFKCRVPLSNTAQYFIVDGVLQEKDDFVQRGDNESFAEKIKKEIAAYSVKKDFKVSTRLEEVSSRLEVPELDGELDGNVLPSAMNILLPKGKMLEKMLQVIAIRKDAKVPDLKYGINICAEEDSSGKIVFCSHTLSEERFSTAEAVNIKVCKGANLDFLVMQNEHNLSKHVTHFNIEVCEGATFTMNLITLHGGDISNNVETYLTGEHASYELDGLYLADGEQKVNTRINLVHNAPKCNSLQLFKGILGGNSLSDFSGEIIVAPEAQKTEAYQSNNNLLTTDTARASSQPHLVIYADDVKCSHGATIGSLDEGELFYMRSRGIKVEEAKLLQQQAFAYAVLEKIHNEELRQRLTDLVERRLRGEFTRCSDCSKHCC